MPGAAGDRGLEAPRRLTQGPELAEPHPVLAISAEGLPAATCTARSGLADAANADEGDAAGCGGARRARRRRPRRCPTNVVGCSGRLVGKASRDRRGGNSASSSGWLTWKTCSGSPRSRQVVHAEVDELSTFVSRTSSLVASDRTSPSTTCPTDINRAARFNAVP